MHQCSVPFHSCIILVRLIMIQRQNKLFKQCAHVECSGGRGGGPNLSSGVKDVISAFFFFGLVPFPASPGIEALWHFPIQFSLGPFLFWNCQILLSDTSLNLNWARKLGPWKQSPSEGTDSIQPGWESKWHSWSNLIWGQVGDFCQCIKSSCNASSK